MSLKLVFAVVILSLAAAETCRKFECANLHRQVCGIVYDTTVQINEDPGDCICQLTAYRTMLVPLDDYPSGATLPAICPSEYEEDDDSSDNSDDSRIDSSTTSIACALNSNKSLASGSYPKACSSSTDCELADGSYGTCTCSSLGTYFCKPDISDPNVFQSIHDNYCKNGVFEDLSQQNVDLWEEMAVDRNQISCYDKLLDEVLWQGFESAVESADGDSAVASADGDSLEQ